ncbi:MAG TPA: c-type cytochrome domain-containing protein [Acidobacteriaceae bacterium]|jgi:cytochrome c553
MKFGSGALLALAGSLTIAAGLGQAVSSPVAVSAKDDTATPAYFTEKVKPILQTNCFRCHAGANHRGGYNMNTRESLLKGGHHGNGVVPGQPEASLMIKLVNHENPAGDPPPMPPAPKEKLSDADLAVLSAWIKAGAVTPADPIFVAPAQ